MTRGDFRKTPFIKSVQSVSLPRAAPVNTKSDLAPGGKTAERWAALGTAETTRSPSIPPGCRTAGTPSVSQPALTRQSSPLLLVQRLRVLLAPAILCHKEPVRGAFCLLLAGSL